MPTKTIQEVKQIMSSYPTKLMTARIICSLGLFAVEAAEVRMDTSDEGAKKTIAASLAYRMKADKSQRLFTYLTFEEVYQRLLSEKYEWQLFSNPL